MVGYFIESFYRTWQLTIYQGPGSWLSICSEPGLRWVASRAGTTKFDQSARGLVMGWTERLSLSRRANRERSTELGPELAWTYVRCVCIYPARTVQPD